MSGPEGISERAAEIAVGLACDHGFDTDASAQQAIAEVLDERAREERAACIVALVAEHANVLARLGTWRRGSIREEAMERAQCALGADRALKNVADRLDVPWGELEARAREFLGALEQEPEPERSANAPPHESRAEQRR
jgi:hypothetical protein